MRRGTGIYLVSGMGRRLNVGELGDFRNKEMRTLIETDGEDDRNRGSKPIIYHSSFRLFRKSGSFV